jgi:hypothetical protein
VLYYVADEDALHLFSEKEGLRIDHLHLIVGINSKEHGAARYIPASNCAQQRAFNLVDNLRWLVNLRTKELVLVGDVDFFCANVARYRDDMTFFKPDRLRKYVSGVQSQLFNSGKRVEVYTCRGRDAPEWKRVSPPPDALQRIIATGAYVKAPSPFTQPVTIAPAAPSPTVLVAPAPRAPSPDAPSPATLSPAVVPVAVPSATPVANVATLATTTPPVAASGQLAGTNSDTCAEVAEPLLVVPCQCRLPHTATVRPANVPTVFTHMHVSTHPLTHPHTHLPPDPLMCVAGCCRARRAKRADRARCRARHAHRDAAGATGARPRIHHSPIRPPATHPPAHRTPLLLPIHAHPATLARPSHSHLLPYQSNAHRHRTRRHRTRACCTRPLSHPSTHALIPTCYLPATPCVAGGSSELTCSYGRLWHSWGPAGERVWDRIVRSRRDALRTVLISLARPRCATHR